MESPLSTRLLKTKYIGEDIELTKELCKFEKSVYINKGSTGMGLTHMYLHDCYKNILILSPNIGMVQSKHEQDTRSHVFYIYGKANGAWGLICNRISQNKQTIINSTADNFISLKRNNPSAYNTIMENFHIVIDECHAIYNNDYSETLPELYSILMDSNLPYVLTTGTSIHPVLESPIGVEIINIKHENPSLKEVRVIERENGSDGTNHLISRHISDCLRLGLKPAIATNDSRRFTVCQHLTKEILAGDKLNTKAKLKTKINEVSKMGDAEIAFFSTRFNTGSDFYGKISINVIADGTSMVDAKSVQEVVQALGRSRDGYQNATVIFKPCHELRKVDTIVSEIMGFDKTESSYASATRHFFKELQMTQTYSSAQTFKESLEKYGLTVYLEEQGEFIPVRESTALVQSIRFLMQHELPMIENSFRHVLNNVQGDAIDTNLYSTKVINCYMIWKLLSLGLIDFSVLEGYEKNDQQGRIIPYVLSTVDTSNLEAQRPLDWMKLVNSVKIAKSICKSKKQLENPDEEKLRRWIGTSVSIYTRYQLAINNQFNSLVGDVTKHQDLYGDKPINVGLTNAIGQITKLSVKSIKKNIERDVLIDLNTLDIPFDDSVIFLLERISDKLVKNLRDNGTLNQLDYHMKLNTEHFLKQYETFGKYLFCIKHNLFLTGFRISDAGWREYNPAVKVAKVFKPLIPISFWEYDIISANPTIVDQLTNSNMGKTIYDSIAERENCSRDKAKRAYNKALNNHFDKNRFQTFKGFGYSDDASQYLAELGKVKGQLYIRMTEIEFDLVHEFVEINYLKSYSRVHDGIICFEKLTNLSLQSGVNFSETHFL